MNNSEKDIIDKIQGKMADVEPPENLQPNQIEKLLQERLEKESAKQQEPAFIEQKSKRLKWKKSYTFSLAAACLAVTILGVLTAQRLFFKEPSSPEFMAVEEYDVDKDRNEVSEASEESPMVSEEGETSVQPDDIAMAKDYDEVYGYIQRLVEEEERANNRDGGLFGFGSSKGTDMVMEDAEALSAEAPAAEPSMDMGGGAPAVDYSETNLREEGVDEADYVKTDGKNLYAKKDNGRQIAIVSATDKMEAVGLIEVKENMQIIEFFLQDNKLIVLCNAYKEDVNYYSSSNTAALTYDITNPEAPKLIGENSQSGNYYSSRIVDGYLYVFSQYYVDISVQPRDRELYIPAVNDILMESTSIILPPVRTANMYMVVTGVEIKEPDKIVDQKAIFLKNSNCYVSQGSIYFYEELYDYNYFRRTNETVIRKINYKDGEITPSVQGVVKGNIHDSFCIDEYDGNLRVVTTIYRDWDPLSNSVYVLDESLQRIGSIEGLAEEERIYSARLMGETGYFVTYRETDPLFSVDFSDPENPQILGALKIPGFSEYLHFYGEGLLLGIGMHTNETDGPEGMIYSEGVKLSMFDISDPTNVKEIEKYIIEGAYSADLFYDYKAVLINVNKNIIGFTAHGALESYYIFSYNETNGFDLEMEEEVTGSSYGTTRGVFVEDRLYVVKGNVIQSYSLTDYIKLDDFIL